MVMESKDLHVVWGLRVYALVPLVVGSSIKGSGWFKSVRNVFLVRETKISRSRRVHKSRARGVAAVGATRVFTKLRPRPSTYPSSTMYHPLFLAVSYLSLISI